MAWKCLSPHQALQQFHTWCFTLRNIFWPLIKTGMTTTASSMGYLPKKQRRSFVMDLMGYLVFVPTEKLSVFCNLVKGHLQAGVLKPWTHSNKHRKGMIGQLQQHSKFPHCAMNKEGATECKNVMHWYPWSWDGTDLAMISLSRVIAIMRGIQCTLKHWFVQHLDLENPHYHCNKGW